MSDVWIFRHGQAGTRDNYDTLSELGLRQARLLGEHLAAEGLRFGAIYAGELHRQRETAAAVCRVFNEAGIQVPEVQVDPAWTEFDLDATFREIAPRLCHDDEVFRREYAELQKIIQASKGDSAAPIHRKWTRCDVAVMRAWVEGRYDVNCESWNGFRQRVQSCEERLCGPGDGVPIAIFTSATPAAIWVSRILNLDSARTLQLAGALYNTAITVLTRKNGSLSLLSFNAIPHLRDPELRTFR